MANETECHIIFFLFLTISACHSLAAPVNVTFVVIGPYVTIYTLASIEAAVEWMRKTYQAYFWADIHLIASPQFDTCQTFADEAVYLTAEHFYNKSRIKPDMEILTGEACATIIAAMVPVATAWNVPYFIYGGNNANFNDKKAYPTTLTVTEFFHAAYGEMFQAFFQKFNWTSVFALCDDNAAYAYYQTFCRNFKTPSYLNLTPGTALHISTLTFDSGKNSSDYGFLLDTAAKYARVILIFANGYVTRKIMIEAFLKNMTSAEYVYAFPGVLANKNPSLTWKYNDPDDPIAFEAFQQVFWLSEYDELTSNNIPEEIQTDIKRRSLDLFNITYRPGQKLSSTMVTTFESAYLAAIVINETLSRNRSLSNSAGFVGNFLNRTFDLPTRKVYFNEKGQRFPNIYINQVDRQTGKFRTVLIYNYKSKRLESLNGTAVYWINEHPPANEPFCGFRGDKVVCVIRELRPVIALSITLACLCIATGALSFFIMQRRRRRRMELKNQWWVINSSLLLPAGPDTDMPSVYRGEPVWCKRSRATDYKTFESASHLLVVTRKLRKFHHYNVNPLCGIWFQNGALTFVSMYCSRKSLQDLQSGYSDSFVDWDLQVSLCENLLEGLTYIHQSFLRFHGNLKDTKCLIDKHFELRLNDAGHRHIQDLWPRSHDTDKIGLFSLHAVSESQRLANAVKLRSDDVFCLGLLLQQIVLWKKPGKDAVHVNLEWQLSDDLTFPPQAPPRELQILCKKCLQHAPKHRPSVSIVYRQFKRIEANSTEHYTQKLLRRLENYANDLEGLVAEKTMWLVGERRKCDNLLTEILPSVIVQRLRQGLAVEAELFDEVTIYFSGMINFADFVLTSSPVDVVTYLSMTYRTIDILLNNFEVYKVETIADSYMIVSGLPIRNGNKHASEIARMASSIMNVFKMTCQTRNLCLRIGMNTGPCAAGVIGTKVPRYCLFGDTINTGSRMENSGEAMRIHVSSSTAQLLFGLPDFVLRERGPVDIKGKGSMMTYWLAWTLENVE